MYQLGNYQQPGGLSGKTNQQQIGDNFLPSLTMGAEGVVQNAEEDGKTINLWLGGIPAQLLPYYDVSSQFTLVDAAENKIDISLRSRTGLKAKAHISDSSFTPQVGQLIQEKIRVLPRNIGFTVALATKLERIERVDATSALSTLSHVTSVITGEQPADCVFGKLPITKVTDSGNSTSTITSPSRYGLFSLASELMPNTVGEAGEAIKIAVQRLAPKIRTMHAAKLWRLTENAGSSQLAVKANLEILNGIVPRIITQRQSTRAIASTAPNKKVISPDTGQLPIIPMGSRIQYRIQNLSDRPIYLLLLGLDTSMNAYALYPWQDSRNSDSSDNRAVLEDAIVEPGKTLIVPSSTTDFQWVLTGPAFFAETQLIFSTAPFKNTLEQQTTKHHGSTQQRISPLLNPVEVAQALLQDLHDASSKADDTNTTSDFYNFNVNNWASFSFIYQVV
jgi:hypothetical protein